MASYPTSLPGSDAAAAGLNHGQVYDELYAALVELGTDPSSAWATVKARLDGEAYASSATKVFRTGRYYDGAMGGGFSASQSFFTELNFGAFWVPRSATFDQISVNITTLLAGSTYRMGIYADNGSGYPGSLTLDAGTVSGASTGVKTAAISQTLTPGLYWLGGQASAGSIGIECVGTNAMYPMLGNASGTDSGPFMAWEVSSAVAAFPSTFPAGAVPHASKAPTVRLRVA